MQQSSFLFLALLLTFQVPRVPLRVPQNTEDNTNKNEEKGKSFLVATKSTTMVTWSYIHIQDSPEQLRRCHMMQYHWGYC